MSLLNFLFSNRLSQEEKNNIEYVRDFILQEIKQTTLMADKVRVKLPKEILVSVVYLQIFASYLKKKKFKNLEQSWKFMNDIKGIIEKSFYVTNYIDTRVDKPTPPVVAPAADAREKTKSVNNGQLQK